MKLRRGKKKDGTLGRANLRLEARIKAWDEAQSHCQTQAEKDGYKKPGSMKK